MSLEGLFDKIKEIFTGDDADPNNPNIRPASEDPMGDPADQQGTQNVSRRYAHQDYDRDNGVLPASQDPMGDPADREQGILPASQDPMGDPADQEDRQNGILPASQDPMGDPADNPRYR